MTKVRHTFIDGIDQDSSPDKTKKTKLYKGINIKVLSEEGLSSGAIENEDGNTLLFKLPDTYATYKIHFSDIENSTTGYINFYYIDPITNTTITINTISTDSIDALYVDIQSKLANLIGTNIKIGKQGKFIYVVLLDSMLFNINGFNGLNNNTTYYIAPQTNLQIIGWGTLRDDIILFTTSETGSTITNEASQIWKLNYDVLTNIITNSVNAVLTLKDHLIYNNKLGLSSYYPIGTEVIGNYENSKTGIVYWTDNFNQLRSANVLDPKLFITSPGQLNIISNVTMNTPVITEVTEGGSIPSGAVVQCCYRLFNQAGNYTVYSPLTNPIYLGDFDPNSTAIPDGYWKANGQVAAAETTKLIKYTISNIDTNFDVIEHIAIVYYGYNWNIYKFGEENVPADGNLDVIYDGTESTTTITREVFSALTRTFTRAKTITEKDKRLIVGNVNTDDNILTGFDTRVYRFNSFKQSLLTDVENTDITLDGNNPSTSWAVPDDFDCVNPYNKDTIDDPTKQYKYQADGVTYGGTGINVSYKFTIHEIPIKRTISGIEINNYGAYDVDIVSRNTEAPIYNSPNALDLNGITRVNPNEFQDMKSPMVSATFKGYTRGEVYRFGIVFYDKESNPFPVKWIGDIRIPEEYDQNPDGTYYSVSKSFGGIVSINTKTNAEYPIIGNSIGLTFTIDVSSIQDKISGFEIVRVERDFNNRTRWGNGIEHPFNATRYGEVPLRQPEGGGLIENMTFNHVNYDGNTNSNIFALFDRPTGHQWGTGRTTTLICPATFMRGESQYSFKTGDYVKNTGFYDYHYDYGYGIGVNVAMYAGGNGSSASQTILYNWNNARTHTRNTITKEQLLQPGDILYKTDTTWTDPSQQQKDFCNTLPASKFNSTRDNEVAGIGGIKQALDLKDSWNDFDIATASPYPQITERWRSLSYCRILTKQYDGDTFEARSKNEYITTGEFFPVSETSNPIITKDIFGGDTYIKQFVYSAFSSNWGQDSRYGTASTMHHLGMSFPCESPINLPYMDINRYGNDTLRLWLQAGPPGNEPLSFSYIIPEHYRLENKVKEIYYPKDFINNYVTEHPNRLWASERKIDGELLDSWRIWLPNNYTEVDGEYGPINKIVTLHNNFYFFQDRAFGAASINDRSTIQDTSGSNLVLGNGGILDYYRYISKNVGTQHKFSVVSTGNAIHFFDINLKKWFRFSPQGVQSVSDVKGLHSFFGKLNGNILTNDNILQGEGIHAVFDKYRNKVYMTFLNAVITTVNDTTSSTSSGSTAKTTQQIENYTLAYNENLNTFESFYDFKPYLSLDANNKLISLSPTNNEGWIHYKGNKNSFYGTIYPSTIEIIVSPLSDITTVFDNIQYKSEIFINDLDVSNLTFDSVRVLNDYQDTGIIPLIVDTNIKRKFRTWRMYVPRDNKSTYGDARMRDYFVKIVLVHTPNNNERLVLHDIITSYRPSVH